MICFITSPVMFSPNLKADEQQVQSLQYNECPLPSDGFGSSLKKLFNIKSFADSSGDCMSKAEISYFKNSQKYEAELLSDEDFRERQQSSSGTALLELNRTLKTIDSSGRLADLNTKLSAKLPSLDGYTTIDPK